MSRCQSLLPCSYDSALRQPALKIPALFDGLRLCYFLVYLPCHPAMFMETVILECLTYSHHFNRFHYLITFTIFLLLTMISLQTSYLPEFYDEEYLGTYPLTSQR